MSTSVTEFPAGLPFNGEVVMRLDSGLAGNSVTEEWCDIEGYEGRYQISNHGRVRSLARVVPGPFGREVQVRERIMRHCYHYKGYPIVFLSKEGIDRKFFVHRLVAIAFIPNPEAKPIVNHKDLNKENCIVLNLEWASVSENTQHYYDNRDEPF